MQHRVAIVTGATGAIGAAIAEGIAAEPGWQVVLLGRDAGRTERAAQEIRERNPGANVRTLIADLSRRASVAEAARSFAGPLHVLVNDAAVAPRRRTETPEGIELQLATNVLGYLWTAQCFEDALAEGAKRSGAPSRIVNVASYWAGDLELDDLEFRRRAYDNDAAYRQSKQANRMLTPVQAEKLRERSIVVNACHPGDVNSKLSNDLGFGGHESPGEGARTPLYLATSEEAAGVSGGWFEQGSARPCRFGADRARAASLMERCAAFGG